MNNDNGYFTYELVDTGIYRILGAINEMAYLINGSSRSVLIDTGCGVGSLLNYVRKFTQKPIDVILSHGHWDHTNGAGEFDNVYLHPNDWDTFYYVSKPNIVLDILHQAYPDLACTITESDIVDSRTVKLKPLKEGMRFDLGGVRLTIFEVSGHTPGSIAVLIEEKQLLFVGDACNNITCMFCYESTTIKDFLDSVKRLKRNTSGRCKQLLFSHCRGYGPTSTITDVIEVCQRILDGTSDEIPYEFLGVKCYKAADFDWISGLRDDPVRKDGGYGNVLFKRE